MLELIVTQDDGSQVVYCLPSPILIGRGKDCDVPLRSWRVARHHARLYSHDHGVAIDDLGSLAGTLLNGQRVVHDGSLSAEDEILIGGYRIQVRQLADAGAGRARQHAREGNGRPPAMPVGLPSLPEPIPVRDHGAPVLATCADAPAAAAAMPDEAERSGWPAAHLPSAPGDRGTQAGDVDGVPAPPSPNAEHIEWRRRMYARLLEAIDLRRRDVMNMSDAALRAEADALLVELVAEAQGDMPPEIDRAALRREVVDEAVGLGPLEALLADPNITEIMVNRYDEVFVEEQGRLRRHAVSFSSDRAVRGVIERIVAPLGRRVDEGSPMVDARLKDGSRVNAVIAPVALKGAALTIRKFPARRMQIDDLVRGHALSEDMAAFLQLCVQQRKNIVVSGGTGSGKTTLLNILSNFVPMGERIVTIEDAAELQLGHAHLVSLEARPPNLEGRGAVSIRDLVRNALRMRPDRIVVGECRGAEALDMLQAMNTGHEGSLTTLHANTARDALARLETMILMAGMDLPLAAIREQIASSIDLIVQQSRSATGMRRITAIVEVSGIESGRIQLQELFRHEQARGGDGVFRGCGIVPGFYEDWRARGLVSGTECFFGEDAARSRDAMLPGAGSPGMSGSPVMHGSAVP
jgi:pilus assembly protein CpaF